MNAVLYSILEGTKENGERIVPKLSPHVMRGTLEETCLTLPDWLNKIFKSAICSLKENIDLKYVGYNYQMPEEVYARRFTMSSSKDSFDLSHSDTYYLKFNFTFEGKNLPLNVGILHLPYGRQGNIMMISGAKYIIAPVLSDTVISPDNKQIFVRLFKDKLTFKHESTNMIFNGDKVECILIHLEIMKNENKKKGKWGNPLSCIALYLLGKYGFLGTLERYFTQNFEAEKAKNPEIDKKRKFSLTKDVIISNGRNPDLEKDYNYFASTRTKPKNFKIPDYIEERDADNMEMITRHCEYQPTDIHIYIHKDIPITPFIKNFCAGVIYSFEILPVELDKMLKYIANGDHEAEKRGWMYILARIAYKGNKTYVTIIKHISEHFKSVEYYIDDIIRGTLRLNSDLLHYEFSNYFDLVYYILDSYSKLTLSSKTYNSDITHRYIDLKYYICYNIIYAFNKVILELNKRSDKIRDTDKKIMENEVRKMFQDYFKQGIIYTMTKGKSGNFNAHGTDYVGDNMYFKCTSVLEDQSCGEGTKKPLQGTRFPEYTKSLHGSDLVIGSIMTLIKAKPSGRFRANIFLDYNIDTGKIKVSKKQLADIRRIDALLASNQPKNAEYTNIEDNILREEEVDMEAIKDIE